MTTEGILGRLEQLVTIESPSGDRDGLVQAAGLMAGWLHEAGFHVATDQTSAGPLVTAERSGGAGRVLVLGHLDTVWELGTLRAMPFRVEAGRVRGPGVFDMKAGLAILAAAATETRGQDGATVTVLLTPDEEVGSEASRQAIEDAARRADLVLVLEPCGADGALKVGRKGVGAFELTVLGRAAHAGLEPERGVDAVEELCHQVLALKALGRPEAGTTVNVGVVRGGTRSNVVAERAHGSVDVRVKTQAEADRVSVALQTLRPVVPGAELRWAGGFNRPPMTPNPTVMRWAATADRIWREEGFPPLEAIEVGGASDGNFTAPLAPTLDGLGPPGGGAHARDEHVLVEGLKPRAELLAALWRQVQ